MKAVILVGGLGTRLRPLTTNTPKPLIPILNRPFIETMLLRLRNQGISEAILAVQYLADRFRQQLGDGSEFGLRLHIVEEPEPRGTAGAVKHVSDLLDDTTFVLNGDVLSDLDLRAMLAFHRARGAAATISLAAVDDPSRYGLVETDAAQRVERFVEKPRPEQVTTNMVNSGTYIIEPALLRHVLSGQYAMFERDLFPTALASGDPVYGYPAKAYWTDIGKPDTYLQVHYDLLQSNAGYQIEGHNVQRGVWLQGEAEIDVSAELVGPVLIGAGCTIGRNVRIIGPAVLGQQCVIAAGAVIQGSVLWANNEIGEEARIEESIIGQHNLIGPRTVVREGAIISDNCRIGSDNRLERAIRLWPGTVLGDQAITF
jgi:mannose-1-phosphate guanylyltransferase